MRTPHPQPNVSIISVLYGRHRTSFVPNPGFFVHNPGWSTKTNHKSRGRQKQQYNTDFVHDGPGREHRHVGSDISFLNFRKVNTNNRSVTGTIAPVSSVLNTDGLKDRTRLMSDSTISYSDNSACIQCVEHRRVERQDSSDVGFNENQVVRYFPELAELLITVLFHSLHVTRAARLA
ncbi:hypothetical protein BaRGS_00023890 [Batillaria attramentaria]|uniref:Uncharacterized protein n=1 Tax=Batillaria attramentaria TaxID=370345 RepID=A0ABD0KCU5_9CAEN